MTREALRDSVLVIDDDADCRTLVETIAEICNTPVLQAPDCREGLEILKREHDRIKMIILDYFMPGLEPAECAQAIVGMAGPSIAVVLLTASVDAGARAAELKINRWISKPFEPSTLINLFTQN